MFAVVRPAAVLFCFFGALTGLAYPLAVTGAAQAVFPGRANGSLVQRGDHVVGSELIGQAFDDPRYFWGRPSATQPSAYAANASAGANLGPSNPALPEAVRERISALRTSEPEQARPSVPVDLVTSSGSGLDPHITPAAALYQVARVSRARHLPEQRVRSLVLKHIEGRWLGLYGEPRVNVLGLNLALDELAAKAPPIGP